MKDILADHCLTILAGVCGLIGTIIAITAKRTWRKNSKFKITSTGLLALCFLIIAITAITLNSYFDTGENFRKPNSGVTGNIFQNTAENFLPVRDSVNQYKKDKEDNPASIEIRNEEKPSKEVIKTALAVDSDKMEKREFHLFVGFDETY